MFLSRRIAVTQAIVASTVTAKKRATTYSKKLGKVNLRHSTEERKMILSFGTLKYSILLYQRFVKIDLKFWAQIVDYFLE